MNTFREEALKHHCDTGYGDIVLPASFGMSVCAIATLLMFLSVALFIYYGSYTRKAHLSGIVMPSSGLVKITPQYAGYVTRQTVSEGQHVVAGEPVYHISGEHYNGQGTGTLAAMSMSLKAQYAMLSSQQALELRDNSQQQQAIKQRIASLKPQIKSAELRLSLAGHQAALAVSVMERYKKLAGTHTYQISNTSRSKLTFLHRSKTLRISVRGFCNYTLLWNLLKTTLIIPWFREKAGKLSWTDSCR